MKFNLRVLIAFLIFFYINDSVFAQSCKLTLHGVVKDAQDSGVLPGAMIKIVELNRIIAADADGNYHINDLCARTYTLQFSFIGYHTSELTISLKSNAVENVLLKREAETLKEVRVAGQRATTQPLQIVSKLSDRDLQLTKGEPLGEALKRIPGLNSMQTGPSISKPVIHGMHSNRVLMYNAGVRQEGQQWGSEHAPEIDPFIANEITVVKGAASVMYGADAMGGVILVEPAALRYQAGISGQVDLVAMSNNGLGAVSGMVEGSPFEDDRFSMRLQGTAKAAADSRAPGYYLKNTGYNEFNGAAMIGFKTLHFNTEFYGSTFNSKLGIFEGAHIGNTTDLLAAIQRDRPLVEGSFNYDIGRPYQSIHHTILKSKSSYMFDDFGKLNFQYSYQANNREEYDLIRRSQDDDYQLKFDLTTQSVDLFFNHKPIAGFSGTLGFNGMMQQNFYDGRYLVPFFKNYNAGFYLIEKWSKQNWELEAGLRYDYKHMQARLRENPLVNESPEIRPEFDFNQVSGTFGAAYRLADDIKVNATVASAWRPPAINELFSDGVHHASARYEIGDRSLKEESSVNLSGGLSKSSGKFNFDLSLYYNNINNYIYLKPLLEPKLTIRGAFRAFQYVQVDALFKGLDASAGYQIDPTWSLSGKYSLVRAFNKATDQHLEFIPADRLSGTLGINIPDYSFGKSNRIDLTVLHVARQSRVTAEQDVLASPEGYTLFNIDASTELKVGSHNWKVSLSGQNIFNKRYRDYMNLFRYFTDDPGRNIVLRLQIPLGQRN